ncbi:MAG: ATP-binding protein [Saprospiraceae bacterium]
MNYYPIVSVTGPRQAGKTTLLRFLFPHYDYVSLENINNRQLAESDPIGFLDRYSEKVIFDEAQRVPDLFSYLQTLVDEQQEMGQFILSGSQNFLLRKNITQSLAGRVGIVRLMPFSEKELQLQNVPRPSLDECIFNGYYPSIYDRQISPFVFYPNYLETYVQRDVQDLIHARNITSFQRFMRLCAGHVGQTIVYSQLANSVGVSTETIRNWLSILEQSYIIFQLQPFYRNFNKRQIKSAKLYFYDTGLLCSLLRMRTSANLQDYYQRGAIFENFVIADIFKMVHHRGERPHFYFWRDNNQNEADLLWEVANQIHILEIKSTKTLKPNHFKNLVKFKNWIPDNEVHLHLVYGGSEQMNSNGVSVWSWQHLVELLDVV